MAKTILPEGFTERLLHTIWQFQYFDLKSLTTFDGEDLSIIHPGSYNVNSGPDFFDARIRIGNTILAGRIELHLRTSDFILHGHERDSNYQNLILHVVYFDDMQGILPGVPVLELSERIPSLFLQTASRLLASNQTPPCRNNLTNEVLELFPLFSERLLIERLDRRSNEILSNLQESFGDWGMVSWRWLCKAFGGPVNAEAFETVSNSFPFKLLSRFKGNQISTEALLFGQSGLLNCKVEDQYFQLLQREYAFLKKANNLKSSAFPMQFLRMRPHNFPTIKLALLSSLVSGVDINKEFFLQDIEELRKTILGVTANDYWHYHYRFGEESSYQPKKLGKPVFDSLMINWKTPLMFSYGRFTKQETLISRALEELHGLKGEENNIIKRYADAGFIISTAGSSQAILELKSNYCDTKKCMDCILGNKILKRETYNTERHFL